MIKDKQLVVKLILEKDPLTRDSDRHLLYLYWSNELISKGYSTGTFLNNLLSGKVSCPETITRARRKVQAENPELRGKRYKERIEKLDPQVADEMREG